MFNTLFTLLLEYPYVRVAAAHSIRMLFLSNSDQEELNEKEKKVREEEKADQHGETRYIRKNILA